MACALFLGCLRGEEAARNGGEGAAKEREEPLGTRGNGSSPADSRSTGRQKPRQAAFGGFRSAVGMLESDKAPATAASTDVAREAR